MAQKGRSGARTYFQRMCPGFTIPKWSPRRISVSMYLCFEGDGICPQSSWSDWCEITEDPATGTFQWSGEVISHGEAVSFTLYQTMTTPVREGVDFLLLAGFGGGYSIGYAHRDVFSFEMFDAGAMASVEPVDYTSPLGPLATWHMKGKPWH